MILVAKLFLALAIVASVIAALGGSIALGPSRRYWRFFAAAWVCLGLSFLLLVAGVLFNPPAAATSSKPAPPVGAPSKDKQGSPPEERRDPPAMPDVAAAPSASAA